LIPITSGGDGDGSPGGDGDGSPLSVAELVPPPPPPPPQAAMSRDVAMIKNRLRRFNVLGIKIHVGIFNRFYECTHKIKKDIEYLGLAPITPIENGS
jgi:hypothetical protein